jgi:flagellar basal body-associated protein FliL
MSFLGFEDVLHFFAFLTKVIYNLIPIFFVYQLFHGVIKKERVSIIAILSLYSSGLIYFLTSVCSHSNKAIDEINPLDFCNLIGLYFGFIYIVIILYFLYFERNKKIFIISIISILIISLVVFLVIIIYVENENSVYKLFNWYFGTIFNILENLPLGFDIIYLIKNKISEKFTLFGASGGILNAVIWLIWAIKKVSEGEKRGYSIVANAVAICLHIMQFTLFFMFRNNEERKTEEKSEEDKGNLEDSSEEENGNLVTKGNPDDTYEIEKRNKKENKIIEEFM